jgi:hypothetical protein
MTYELAKELKDAGFPQITFDALKPYVGTCYDPQGNNYWSLKRMTPEWTYSPTLEELIEACNTAPLGFIALRNETGFWSASGWHTNRKDWIQTDGLTPKEAVARLWLALNRKKE